MNKRRNKADIMFDMLQAINEKGGKIIPTHLLYKSNLSHDRMIEYLKELKEKKLVAESVVEAKSRNKTFYSLTTEGREFLSRYRQLREFSEAFGL